MTELEKVIKGIDICLQRFHCGEDCPYYNDAKIGCEEQLREDALDLLKEQEDLGTELTNAVELIHKKNERIKKLLKEQESIEPICQIIFDVPYYFCGSCKTMLNMYAVKAKYCSQCGRQVKWK